MFLFDRRQNKVQQSWLSDLTWSSGSNAWCEIEGPWRTPWYLKKALHWSETRKKAERNKSTIQPNEGQIDFAWMIYTPSKPMIIFQYAKKNNWGSCQTYFVSDLNCQPIDCGRPEEILNGEIIGDCTTYRCQVRQDIIKAIHSDKIPLPVKAPNEYTLEVNGNNSKPMIMQYCLWFLKIR